ncbi:MAG: hypothetical protein APF76_09205 [Desulfitibacter sp. BRH_c19]|nr:MAG: hypothetical protein APF76_09205 [Desulfitibacter sp. BRH_c19]
MKSDRATAGAIAGILGAITQDIYGLTVKGIGLTDRAFIDFAKVIAFRTATSGTLSFITGLVVHLTLGMMFGLLFSYIISMTSSNFYYYKAIGYSAGLWFWTLAVGSMVNLPLFAGIPVISQITTFVGALIFGLAMAYSLKLLENKTEIV